MVATKFATCDIILSAVLSVHALYTIVSTERETTTVFSPGRTHDIDSRQPLREAWRLERGKSRASLVFGGISKRTSDVKVTFWLSSNKEFRTGRKLGKTVLQPSICKWCRHRPVFTAAVRYMCITKLNCQNHESVEVTKWIGSQK